MDEPGLSQSALVAVLAALIADELKALRHAETPAAEREAWHAGTSLRDGDDEAGSSIGADSMELLSLASVVSDFFCLHDSGLDDYLLRHHTLGGWAEVITAIRAEGIRDITFRTSGSTGKPRPCVHRWASLVSEVDEFTPLFDSLVPGGIRRVICLAQPHHIYGFLFGILLPERAGLEVVRGTRAFSRVQGRRLQAGDLVVGYPFVWQLFARQGAVFAPEVVGLTSTGPIEPQVLSTLSELGLAHMVEIHGASEAGGIGVRYSPQAPYALLRRWRRGEDANHIVGENPQMPVVLADHLEWQDERHYWPVGRVDQAVQVGGINVYPQRVATLLETHPAVRKASVRLMNAAEGERLKAFIVPADASETQDLAARLTRWCQERLDAPSIPGAFTIGSYLPRNAQGKLADWPLDV